MALVSPLGGDQTLAFQIKFCGKSPALRVAAKRYAAF